MRKALRRVGLVLAGLALAVAVMWVFAPREPVEARKKFLDTDEHRAIVLGKVQTDEEARLAAEIEKLRD
mgnify:CR=1 FL=1